MLSPSKHGFPWGRRRVWRPALRQAQGERWVILPLRPHALTSRARSISTRGIAAPGGQDEITRVTRQNNSGTVHYFKEVVGGKKIEFCQGAVVANGSNNLSRISAEIPGPVSRT